MCIIVFTAKPPRKISFQTEKNRRRHFPLGFCVRKFWRRTRAALQWRKVFRVEYRSSRLSLASCFFTAKSPRKISFQTGKNRSCYLVLRRCARKLWRGIRTELQRRKVFRFKYCSSRLSLAPLFFHHQVAKEDRFSNLNISPRVCPWRSWRLGVLKFFSFEQISLSENT